MINRNKAIELALVTSIIIHEDILNGSLFQTFDKAYKLAEAFLKEYPPEDNWKEVRTWSSEEIDYDELIIEFSKKEINKAIQ